MSVLARWCHRHRVVTVLLWLALLVGLGGVSAAAGTAYNDQMSIPASESSRAMDLLKGVMPAQSGDSDTVVWKVDGGTVDDPAVKARMTQALDTIRQAPGVASVVSPYDPRGAAQVSPDHTIAYAKVDFAQAAHNIPKAQVVHVMDLAKAARSGNLDVQLGGQAVSGASREMGSSAELVGVLAALVILGLVFRSFAAASLPILTGVAGVSAGILGVGAISHLVSISSTAPTLGTLVGLGVGIDYALFIVNRHRRGLMAGLSVEESVAKALTTSGRAVLFAGATVVIALLGMFALGLSFLNGMAIGAATTVAMTVLAAITLLPALLGLMKLRVLSRKQRRELAVRRAAAAVAGTPAAATYEVAGDGPGGAAGAHGIHGGHGDHTATDPGLFARWARGVQARPLGKAVLAVAVMAVVALPVFSLRLGSSDAGNDPKSSTTRQAYDLLAEGFGPGSNGPLMLVAQAPAAGDQAALGKLVETLKHTPGIASVTAVPMQPGQTVGLVDVVPTTSPQSAQTSDLIDHLRSDVIPPAEAGTGLHVMVSGSTALGEDFNQTLIGKLPLFVAIIVGLGCVLMMLAFRSVLIPLIGVAMNLLTMGVAFGSIVAVFQWGWGSEALGAGGAGPVEAFVPVIVIAILFGLSMDYQVFLISRMHEEWTHTGDNARSVRAGHAETGQVICAAAVIMASVFAAFVAGGQRMIAEFGVALALAILLDVLLLRMVLVPALMHRLGAANWWLPRWLDRALPNLSVEGAPEPVPATSAGPAGRSGGAGAPGTAGEPGEPGPELIGAGRHRG